MQIEFNQVSKSFRRAMDGGRSQEAKNADGLGISLTKITSLILVFLAFVSSIPVVMAEDGGILHPLKQAAILHKRPIPPFLVREGSHAPSPFKALMQERSARIGVLVFWVEWCPPCLVELSDLDRFVMKNKPLLAREGIAFFPIALRAHGDSMVPTLYRRYSIRSLPVYWSEEIDLLGRLSLEGFPATMIVNARGEELARANLPIRWMHDETIPFLKGLFSLEKVN